MGPFDAKLGKFNGAQRLPLKGVFNQRWYGSSPWAPVFPPINSYLRNSTNPNGSNSIDMQYIPYPDKFEMLTDVLMTGFMSPAQMLGILPWKTYVKVNTQGLNSLGTNVTGYGTFYIHFRGMSESLLPFKKAMVTTEGIQWVGSNNDFTKFLIETEIEFLPIRINSDGNALVAEYGRRSRSAGGAWGAWGYVSTGAGGVVSNYGQMALEAYVYVNMSESAWSALSLADKFAYIKNSILTPSITDNPSVTTNYKFNGVYGSKPILSTDITSSIVFSEPISSSDYDEILSRKDLLPGYFLTNYGGGVNLIQGIAGSAREPTRVLSSILPYLNSGSSTTHSNLVIPPDKANNWTLNAHKYLVYGWAQNRSTSYPFTDFATWIASMKGIVGLKPFRFKENEQRFTKTLMNPSDLNSGSYYSIVGAHGTRKDTWEIVIKDVVTPINDGHPSGIPLVCSDGHGNMNSVDDPYWDSIPWKSAKYFSYTGQANSSFVRAGTIVNGVCMDPRYQTPVTNPATEQLYEYSPGFLHSRVGLDVSPRFMAPLEYDSMKHSSLFVSRLVHLHFPEKWAGAILSLIIQAFDDAGLNGNANADTGVEGSDRNYRINVTVDSEGVAKFLLGAKGRSRNALGFPKAILLNSEGVNQRTGTQNVSRFRIMQITKGTDTLTEFDAAVSCVVFWKDRVAVPIFAFNPNRYGTVSAKWPIDTDYAAWATVLAETTFAFGAEFKFTRDVGVNLDSSVIVDECLKDVLVADTSHTIKLTKSMSFNFKDYIRKLPDYVLMQIDSAFQGFTSPFVTMVGSGYGSYTVGSAYIPLFRIPEWNYMVNINGEDKPEIYWPPFFVDVGMRGWLSDSTSWNWEWVLGSESPTLRRVTAEEVITDSGCAYGLYPGLIIPNASSLIDGEGQTSNFNLMTSESLPDSEDPQVEEIYDLLSFEDAYVRSLGSNTYIAYAYKEAPAEMVEVFKRLVNRYNSSMSALLCLEARAPASTVRRP